MLVFRRGERSPHLIKRIIPRPPIQQHIMIPVLIIRHRHLPSLHIHQRLTLAVFTEIPTPGVDPPKNRAISAAVPVGLYGLPCGETVTTICDDRSTSPAAPLSALHPATSGFAITPYPGPIIARALSKLSVTRTIFGA
jgi:hypothetical protein